MERSWWHVEHQPLQVMLCPLVTAAPLDIAMWYVHVLQADCCGCRTRGCSKVRRAVPELASVEYCTASYVPFLLGIALTCLLCRWVFTGVDVWPVFHSVPGGLATVSVRMHRVAAEPLAVAMCRRCSWRLSVECSLIVALRSGRRHDWCPGDGKCVKFVHPPPLCVLMLMLWWAWRDCFSFILSCM